MACLISFSRRVSLIHARRYCKMSQNSIFEKTNALFHAKECFACFKYREYSSATDVADGTLDSEATHEKVQNCIRESMHLLKEMTAQQNKRDFLFVSENEKFPTYRPIMSIRKSVLEMEVSLVLEIMKSLRVSDEPMLTMKIPRESILKLYYFEEKWTRILQRDDIPRVKQLMTLMEMADITQEEFCRAMSIFSIFPPANIEIRPLAEFTHEEIDAALLCHFRRDEGVDMLFFGRLCYWFRFSFLPVRKHPLIIAMKKTFKRRNIHELRWTIILGNTADPRVLKILKRLEERSITPAFFCQAMGKTYDHCSVWIHEPDSDSKKDLKAFLIERSFIDEITTKCVADVLFGL